MVRVKFFKLKNKQIDLTRGAWAPMASSKLILRAEEVAMREAGAKAATLTREARAKILANMIID